ncbi:MAG: cupin domain-containing protein [Thermoleophilaceae bacterium]|nr:cupin domain-containing protein [Thermoleophilaceae bacterium]
MEQGVIEDPVMKQRLEFQPSEDGTAVLVKMWVEPGGGVPPHVHPSMEERFTVLSGQPSFLSGRRWQTAAPGDTVVVPAGVRHAYRNRGDELAHVVCQASPAMSLQEFLEEAAAMARAGKMTRHGLPKSPGALVQALGLALRHRKMVVMRPV